MGDCTTFRLFVGEQLPDLMPLLIAEIQKHGGTCTGTQQAGSISISVPLGGTIAGAFQISGRSLVIEIHSRPGFITCGTIESKLQDLILDVKLSMRRKA